MSVNTPAVEIITINWIKPPACKFREVIEPASASSLGRIRPIRAERRAGLIRAIARGGHWLEEIIAGTTSIDGLAQRQNCSVRQINMTLSPPLALLRLQRSRSADESPRKRLPERASGTGEQHRAN